MKVDWLTITDVFTIPAMFARTLTTRSKVLITKPPDNWSGGMLANYLRNQGVSVGGIGITDDEGDVQLNVDDYQKAIDALARLRK